MVSTYPNKITKIKSSLKCYDNMVYTVARIEYSRLQGSHVMDFTELLAIGRLVISDLLDDEENEYNISYMSTAIKWAIRNELRRRYKWYVAKEDKNADDKGDREQVYTTILSINELQDQENPVQIVDRSITPDKKCEFEDMNVLIEQSIKKLPTRERSIIESRFYNDKRIKDIAEEFNISPSRISRIIQTGLDKIKKDLQRQEAIC